MNLNENFGTVGIVILNYITWEETKKCIISIKQQGIQVKIYVVDNNSPNPPSEDIILFFRDNNIIYIPNNENKGYSAGNNIGIKAALQDNCEYILISNSDIIFLNDSIPNMINSFLKDERIGIVGPLVLTKTNDIQKSTRFFEGGMKQKYLCETFLRIFFPKIRQIYYGNTQDYLEENYVSAVSGCCFVMNRECALAVTPFDENTFLYEEEAILAIKMKENNFKTFYVPQSTVRHEHGGSTKNVKSFSYICRIQSEIYYCKQYLNKKTISILPLYSIRFLSYIVKSIKYPEYRRSLFRFIKITFQQLF